VHQRNKNKAFPQRAQHKSSFTIKDREIKEQSMLYSRISDYILHISDISPKYTFHVPGMSLRDGNE